MTPYYEESGITIYHGKAEDVLPRLPLVDLFFTSPPYNLGMTGSRARLNPALRNGYEGFPDAMPWDEYELWQKRILLACWDRLSPTGAIFYNHKPRPVDKVLFNPLSLNPGLPLRQIIIWRRSGGVNYAETHFLSMYEWVLLFARRDFKLSSRSASAAGDVWDIAQEHRDLGHPCPFPVELPSRALASCAAASVCDPFCGSGTTLVAAKRAGILGIGIEQSERYCELAVERLRQGTLFAAAI